MNNFDNWLQSPLTQDYIAIVLKDESKREVMEALLQMAFFSGSVYGAGEMLKVNAGVTA